MSLDVVVWHRDSRLTPQRLLKRRVQITSMSDVPRVITMLRYLLRTTATIRHNASIIPAD